MSEKFEVAHYSISDKLIWALAQLGTSLVSGVFATTLPIFYHVYLGLDPFFISIAAWLYAIWNALNDPIFGYISDKTKSKKGRRIPFLRYTAPFLALTFILVWFVPPSLDDFSIFLWMLISMALYDTSYTIIGLVYSALLPEVTEDDKERGELQKFSSLFYLFGAILGFLIPDLIRPHVGDPNLIPLYSGVIVIGIVSALLIYPVTYRFKERPEFTQVDKPLGLKDSIKYTFKSKSFIVLATANFMSIFFQQIILSFMFYLADYVLMTSTILLLAALFIGLIVGVLLSNILAKKVGVVQADQILLCIGGIPLILIPFISEFLIYVCLFFAGVGLSGPLVLTNVLFAQVADEDETKSGVRREASFFGVNAMLTKPAQSAAIALGPWLIELAGFNSALAIQPEPAMLMIRILIGLIPGVAALLEIMILMLYPLKSAYLKEIQEKVLVMHSEKKAKLEAIRS